MNDKIFSKLSKKEKLAIPQKVCDEKIRGISRVLFIPTRYKNSGYSMCAFFVCKNEKWYRMADYDCFRFINAHSYFRGDFENGGVQFFLEEGDWEISYGGNIKRIK